MSTLVAGARHAPFSRLAKNLRRAARRAANDPHTLLAVGLTVPTILVHVVNPTPASSGVVALCLLYIAVQTILATASTLGARIGVLAHPVPRLALAVLFVTAVVNQTGDASFRPLAGLYIPVVTMAAAYGGREALVIGALVGLGYFGPALLSGEHFESAVQRGMVLTSVCVLLALGTRSTVSKLEMALHRLRLEMGAARRRNRQVEAVEAVGRALAARGPEAGTLEQVMDLLHDNLGYSHVSIYLVDGDKLRLGAQRGYERPIETFDGTTGVIGRIIRNRRAELITDIARDPDYLDVAGDVTSEVCAPLLVDGELLGVVNIESNRGPLDESDLNLVLLVADRLASALALARERRSLAERADLFQRLTAFGNSITGSLDAEILYPTIVDGVRRVLHSDIVVLTVLDRATGRYLIQAMSGGDTSFVGTEIRPGEGVSGRAIRDRTVVVDERLGRERFPHDVQAAKVPDVLTAIGLPLIRDGAVVGAMAVTRTDLDLPFSRIEREVSGVLGSQIALALTNTFLHSDVTEASVRDALTGLFNRRHLDASVDRFLAARRRQAPEQRVPATVILFDLDHFGAFNKLHGHRIGDVVLRGFGELLLQRFRASDLVARYGGEEFVAVLDGATLDDGVRIANEIRMAWATKTFTGVDGEPLHSTVSAGCARLEDDAASADELFTAADVGLAMAKAAGRDLVVAA
jgi:diguanylate cyclase (GGDEF)-like protein